MKQALRPVLAYLVPVAVLGIVAQAVLPGGFLASQNPFAAPCARPLTYAITAYDPRFGLSEDAFAQVAREAAVVWNDASGKTLIEHSASPAVRVIFAYDERQEAVALGEAIEAEQQEYDRMKAEIGSLRQSFRARQSAYSAAVRAYERDAGAYQEEVAGWNARGGAPEPVYRRLESQKAALSRRQERLDAQAAGIEQESVVINGKVDALNALVTQLNRSADTYNETLGHDFDQGNYLEDGKDRTITIYTFEDRQDLARVLAHEFGHALGIEHVENPDSVMYSYNIGDSLSLSAEDTAALREACRL